MNLFNAAWASAQPFPHVVIDGLWPPAELQWAADSFPDPEWPHWVRYAEPPRGPKLALCDQAKMPLGAWEFLGRMASPAVAGILRRVTGIEGLISDATLYGAGLHLIPPGGQLGVHRDHTHNPNGMERRLSMVVYASDCEGGELELWSHDVGWDRPGVCCERIASRFNRTVVFEASDRAWHGHPSPVLGPEPRKSLAVYFLAPAREGTTRRAKAEFA